MSWDSAPLDETFEILVEQSLKPYMADAAARLSYVERSLAIDIVGSAFASRQNDRQTTRHRPQDQPCALS